MAFLCKAKGRAPRPSVRGALAFLLFLKLSIDVIHELYTFGDFIFGHGRLVVIVVIVEKHREYIGDGLALWVTHRVNSGVGTFSEELVLQRVTATVAPDDAAHLPELDFI